MATARIITAALLAAAVGCERSPQMEPAAGALQPRSLEDAAMTSRQGVRVIAQAHQWPADANVTAEVTPLRIMIDNQSSQAIQIRYSGFDLTAPDGTTYHAIPPYAVNGIVETQTAPAFGYTKFHMAPYYGRYYSDLKPYEGPFGYDAGYYDSHYNYWQATSSLPTTDMLTRALPEGVLDASGSLDGFLYFESLREQEGTTLTFRADLKNAETEQAFVSLRMPFVLDRGS